MPNDPHQPGDAEPPSPASAESLRRGYESLLADGRGVGWMLLIFFVAAGFMLWGLWGLLAHYIGENRPEEAAASAAPALPVVLRSPLEPMPQHNDADWQDLIDLRQRENADFRSRGWEINRRTGEAIISPAVSAMIRARYVGKPMEHAASSPQFPPPMAPVPAGPQESLDWANLFPPVGAAASEEKKDQSVSLDNAATQGSRE